MAEVHIVDIDGEQWDIKDSPLTQRVAVLETLTNELQEETELIELDDIVLNPALTFNGNVIKRGKLVTISGAISMSQQPSGAYISNLPINKSTNDIDNVVTWTDSNGNFLGQTILSFHKNSSTIVFGAGAATSYPTYGQLNISYITE